MTPRSRIQRKLHDPIWLGATDGELAEHVGAPESLVAAVREEMAGEQRLADARALLCSAQVMRIVSLAREIMQSEGRTGGVFDFVADVLMERARRLRRDVA